MKFFKTWKEVMFNPLNFYAKLPQKFRYREASIFYLKVNALILGIVALLILLFVAILSSTFGSLFGQSQVFAQFGFMIVLLIIIIALPILLLINWGFLFLGAGIIHLFVLMFGSKQGYQETFKALAYSQAPAIFSIIPFIGYAAAVYSVILEIIGIKERHKLDWGRSVAVILIPFFICLALSIFLFFMIFSLASLY